MPESFTMLNRKAALSRGNKPAKRGKRFDLRAGFSNPINNIALFVLISSSYLQERDYDWLRVRCKKIPVAREFAGLTADGAAERSRRAPAPDSPTFTISC